MSLGKPTGYLEINKHGSTLSFIYISSPFGKNLRFLIDTGASTSFIKPKYIDPKKQITCKPINISTVLQKYTINKQITLPSFVEFNTQENFTFWLFNFHNYFDGLIGLDILKQLKAKIDLDKQILITENSRIAINLKPNFTSGKIIIPALSKTVVKLPVDVPNGDIYVNSIELKPELYTSAGIYTAENWFCPIEVKNHSYEELDILIEQPLKVEKYNQSEFIEFHNIESKIQPDNINIENVIRTTHLNEEEKKTLIRLCLEFNDIFFKEGDNLTFTNKIKHKIITIDEIPIQTKSYRYPYVHKDEVKRQISGMLEQGIIQHSYSPWSSLVWVVPKKQDDSGKQKWRLVIDYRQLNKKTVSDRYPIPNKNEILDKLGRCLYFTTLDLASVFHQIEMDSKDIQKTAFTVEGGHYEYKRMPFGLKNAPSTFQRVMDHVLKDLVGKNGLVYLDDIIIFSTSLKEHIYNIKEVFQKLRECNFKVQTDKSEFLKKEKAFLGHIVTTNGIKPNPDKITAIKKFPIPKKQKEIKGFLGLLGYYRKFIKKFIANIVKTLTECLKKGKVIKLTEKYVKTFEHCKNLIINDPILQYPNFEKPFILTTVASNVALGVVLSQGPIGKNKPICYASRTFSDTETNYSIIEKELLAIIWATKYFRPYLYGQHFTIVTDHRPLTWLMGLKEPNAKLVRWKLKLEEYDYDIVYKKGNVSCLFNVRACL